MLARLLESKKQTERSFLGAVLSTIAHTAAIGVAVFATAQARIDERPPAEIVRWVAPRPAAAPSQAPSPRRPREPRVVVPRPAVLAIDRIDVVIPPVDLTPSLLAYDRLPNDGPAVPRGASADSDSGVASLEPFSAEQVERQVFLRPGNSPPRYPNALRTAGIEGQVIVQFVVNEEGRIEPGSVRFARSDNPLFEAAVRDALVRMRFGAAEVGGKKVRQLVQMPFVFSLSR
ncbi:MAG: energy transducer TonB [Gemmatimonadaceae bacterium]